MSKSKRKTLYSVADFIVMPALASIFAFTLAAAQPSSPTLPGSGTRTFPETGKTVTGIFLDYWTNNGGLSQQGFPISELMSEVSDLDGKSYTVQYFERAVFEHHPENKPPFNVLLSQLGTFQYRQKYTAGAPNQQANNSTGSQLFSETGKRVGGKFLEYWRTHGGLAQQGFPISDEFTEVSDLDGKEYRVQYFERAVFEMHPENQPPFDVLLSQLGTFQYRAKYAGGAPSTPGTPSASAQATQSPQAPQTVEGLFDVGGHKLWLSCRGQGSPTVLMEAGLGTASTTWSRIVPNLESMTRVCAYDRANVGRSERGPAPRTSEQAVKELRALLAAAQVAGPYVLVAHSHGGLHAQLFASKYPSEVAGMVMVDVTTYDIDERYEAVITPQQAQERRDLISQNRESVTYDDIRASYAQVRNAGPLPSVTLIVLTHGRTLEHPAGWPVEAVERAWREAQENLALRSPLGKLVVAQNSGHFIQQDEPQLVVDSIREALEAARR